MGYIQPPAHNQQWDDDNSQWVNMTGDAMTNAAIGITYEHHEVHQGDAFICDTVTTGTLGDNATLNLAFKTGSGTTRAHMIIEFSTLIGGNLELFEGSTWTDNTGTTIAIRNRRRLSTMASSVMQENKTIQPAFTATNNMLRNVTLSTTSATLLHDFFAWGIKNKDTGGSARDVHEWVLKPDTIYAVRFTAEGANNKAQMILNWYEHPDSNTLAT